MIGFEQAARESGVIPEAKVASLLASLKKIPDFSWVLMPPHPTEPRLQGDLLGDFPVALVDHDGKPICHRLAVVVLNNTCDLEPNRSQYVMVAPAFDFIAFSEYIIKKRGEASAANYLRDVRCNHVHEILWLPPMARFKGGAIVYLDRVGAVSAKLYDEAVAGQRQMASFSQNGFYFLLIKMTNYIARAETDEVFRQTST